MAKDIDLTTASRDVLIDIITRQQAVIGQLQRRIESLEGKAKPGGPKGMPGLKPKSGGKPPQPKKPRQARRQGFA